MHFIRGFGEEWNLLPLADTKQHSFLAKLTVRRPTCHMHMSANQVVLQLMKLVLAGDFRR